LPVHGQVNGRLWGATDFLPKAFQTLGSRRKRPQRATKVKAIWDEQSVYLGFQCDSPDVAALSTQRDSPLFREEACEFFLRVPGREDYWEFQGNSASVIYDAHVPRFAARRLWQRWCCWNAKGVRYRATVQPGQGWQATWALPWNDLEINPIAEMEIQIKLCRVADDQFLDEQELSCWPPSVTCFDEPQSWGRLRLSQ
jgi:hypothetical protein